MTAPLRLGLPSKGRLQDQTAAYFLRAGIRVERTGAAREYAGRVNGVDDIEPVFLQAGEIPRGLAAGEIHLGVTGEDMIRERIPAWEAKTALIKALGFGRADLVVSVPKCWIDVTRLADLDDVAATFRARHDRPLRVATKYLNLTRAFFRARDVADYRLIESQGATEGAPANGAAEVIVDITSSGETLRANHLKIITDGLILASQAHLCASLTADWSDTARGALRALLTRLEARERAEAVAALRAKITFAELGKVRPALFEMGCEINQEPERGHSGPVALRCPRSRASEAAALLTEAGALTIEVSLPNMVFEGESEACDIFLARLVN